MQADTQTVTMKRERTMGRPPYQAAAAVVAMPPVADGPDAWALWLDHAARTIKSLKKVPGRVAVYIRCGETAGAPELGAISRLVLGALATFEVIDNAASVSRTASEWAADVEPNTVTVEVRQISGPVVRKRMSEAAFRWRGTGAREATAA
jgi:hypothetical protein